MCKSYASAVNANDSEAYSTLFTAGAIRMPPGTEPEYGPEEIRRGEQADYDVARWSIRSTPIDALQIDAAGSTASLMSTPPPQPTATARWR